jgi:hypothetical protein
MTDPDMDRLAKFVERACATDESQPLPEELWPQIRDRIESAKVVELAPQEQVPSTRGGLRLTLWIGAGAAAAIGIFTIGRVSGRFTGASSYQEISGTAATFGADSTTAYEEQARILSNRLELERSLLRPEALASIDHDLHVVNAAIAELDAAAARDPNNPVVRRLLASSYREKVDILKRVANAE